MDKSRTNIAVTPPPMDVQVVVVTVGPYAGRIGENDDDDFVPYSRFSPKEKEAYSAFFGWIDHCDLDTEEQDLNLKHHFGAHCEIVYFGTLLSTDCAAWVPTGALRPANMSDLVRRYDEISEKLLAYRFGLINAVDEEVVIDLMREKDFIVNEIWRREAGAMEISGGQKVIFLCHSSEDKHIVRMVRNDLAARGFSPWIDEFEINVGDSIVEKIDQAQGKADAVIVFLSEASIRSGWVKREWQSGLMRKLGGSNVEILPARLDETPLPAILSDILYADFRTSYDDGISALFRALKNKIASG